MGQPKTREPYGLWCPICQTGKDKRLLTKIQRRRQERAWRKDQQA